MTRGYRPGRHRVVCDQTGQEVWDDEVVTQWDGLVVRKKSRDKRHPQELIRARPEQGPVYPLRPVPPVTYVDSARDFLLIENAPADEFWCIMLEDGGYLCLEGDGT